MPVKLNSSGGGSVTLDVPVTASNFTLTLPPTNATLGLTQATSQTASSTFVDFTDIPSWARRITVMFNGISTNGTSLVLLRVGTSGGIVATGYTGAVSGFVNASNASVIAWSTGASITNNNTSSMAYIGAVSITLLTNNTWVFSGVTSRTDVAFNSVLAGQIALSGTLDRLRLTTVNGTDTFDAGTINIMYEG
jgi:hypothetical protein